MMGPVDMKMSGFKDCCCIRHQEQEGAHILKGGKHRGFHMQKRFWGHGCGMSHHSKANAADAACFSYEHGATHTTIEVTLSYERSARPSYVP